MPHFFRHPSGPPGVRRINGSRGKFLLTCALIYCLVGWSFFPGPSATTGNRDRVFGWIPEQTHLPLWALGVLWIIPAMAAVVGAFTHRPHDRIAFAVCYLAPLTMCLLYLVATLRGYVTEGALGILLYGYFAAQAYIVSGMEGDKERAERNALREILGGD